MANREADDSLSGGLAAKVLQYLVAHPRAKDTIRGIEKWWLSASLSLKERRILKLDLQMLAATGWLKSRHSAESGTIYSLNSRRLSEIKKFLDRS